jgi:hypothetical protein
MELLKESLVGFQDYFQNFSEYQDWILEILTGWQPCHIHITNGMIRNEPHTKLLLKEFFNK